MRNTTFQIIICFNILNDNIMMNWPLTNKENKL